MELARFAQECQAALWLDNPECKEALAYLTQCRGLSESTIKKFGLGYCRSDQEQPDNPEFNPEPPKEKQVIQKIIVPVLSEFGEFSGVAARSYKPDVKGWWNNRFEKKTNLFGFNVARQQMFAHDKVYLFEGYMDVIVLSQDGLLNSCGLMSTVLGYRRIGLLKRYCNRVCLCFDSDANHAGQMAQVKSIYELSRFRFDAISKIDLPIGVDPDEFVVQNGLDEFLNLEVTLTKSEIKQNADLYLKSLK